MQHAIDIRLSKNEIVITVLLGYTRGKQSRMEKGRHFGLLYQYIGLVLFAVSLLIAFVSFDEYGINWDETQQKRTGEVAYNYVFSNDNSLLEWKDRDYGVAFELPLIILEKGLNLNDSRDIYLMRHLVTHFFFLFGCYFLFLLIDYLYKNKLLATIGFLLVLLHPRLYSHSFFNSKDIPFMSMFIISLYYSVRALDKKTILSFLKLGICVGLLINLRIMGVILPACIVLLLVVDAIREKSKLLHLKVASTLFVSSCLTLYITWPFLWTDPIRNFVFAFKNMSKFRWGGTVLFNGEMIKATEIDWTYLPTWFSITTPIVYLILGIVGFFLLVFQFSKTPLAFFNNSVKRHNLLFLALFIGPVMAVILLKSVLYDGWRQLYFIYPSFALLIVYGLHLLSSKKIFTPALSLLIISFITASVFMVRYYPVQNVYFNNAFAFSPPEYLRENFEMDYWGVSYKKAIEHLLKVDSSASIKICLANTPDVFNKDILRPSDRIRINIVPEKEASYFITNFRWHPQEYDEYEGFKFHSFTVENNTVYQIFKLE